MADAAEALRLLVGGDQVTTYNEGDEQYEVHLRAEPGIRRTPDDIGGLTVPSARLGGVELMNIARFKTGSVPAEIQRLNRERQVTVYASLLPGTGQTDVMDAMQAVAAGLGMGPDYQTRFAGRSRELTRTARAFLVAFGLSLAFMYLILAAQFESWLHPVTILLALPLTLPFALLSIIVAGQSINIFSSLGLLVLFGVVKKNSILQIDRANQLRAQGITPHAAVMQACRDRLRPILMTTLSFVAGMVPLVISGGVGSGTNRAIGFVIIGGQTLVLVLTLVVTPVAYSLFDDAAKLRLGSRLLERLQKAGTWALARIRPAGAAGGMILVSLLAAGQAWAQMATVPAGLSQEAPAGTPSPVLRLTLDEAVKMGLEHNLDIKVDRLEPQIADERVGQARAVFVPTLSTSVTRNSQLAPPSSFLVGTAGVQTILGSAGIGMSQRLPWFGASYAIGWDGSHSTSTSLFTNFNPTLTARFQVAFSQPLLKDFRIDASRQQLIVSKRNRDISDTRFRETVVRTLADVKRAYWDVVAARALVEVQQKSLDLARDLVRINRARVEVGQAPPLDLVSARAEEAQREEGLTIAEVNARQAEDRLRVLILDPSSDAFWTTAIDPIDRPDLMASVPDVDAVILRALERRQDLVRARRELENAETAASFYHNQTLPDVRLQVNVLGNGLAGTRLIRTGGFPGTQTGTEPVPFSDALRQVLHLEYPTWTVGINISYPLGRGLEEASLARSRLELEQAHARLQSTELRVVRQLRQAAWQIEMNAKRIGTSRAARALAEERLNAEQKRFEVGMSTSFLVVQAQRDLAQARNNELSAMLDYVRAVIDFEMLQEAGPAQQSSTASTLSVTGSTLTPAAALVPASSSGTTIRVP
jgi:HAE1 family hydrophobic/amphiphilic exporter-1